MGLPAAGKYCRLLTVYSGSPISDRLFDLSGIAGFRTAPSEVRPRRPLSYLKCKQSILTGRAQKRQERDLLVVGQFPVTGLIGHVHYSELLVIREQSTPWEALVLDSSRMEGNC